MRAPLIIILVIVAMMAIALSLFTVKETEYAIKFELGKIVRTDYTPGLYVKVPFINNVRKFDNRVQTIDMPTEEMNTTEQKYVDVDYFVTWRITDPGQFYITTRGGDVAVARDRLSQIIKNGLRDEFAKRTLKEVVAEQRAEIMDKLTQIADQRVAELGIDVVDVRIKQIELTQEVLGSVFQRMETERLEFANELRSLGRESAERIRSEADREVQVILAEAQRDGDRIRGQGDARSTDIYAQAYNVDSEFYSFYRSLQAYNTAFNSPQDMLILDPSSEFFNYFDAERPRAGNGQ